MALKPPVIPSFKQFSAEDFIPLAKEIAQYQRHANAVYDSFRRFRSFQDDHEWVIEKVPFLPIRFFKTHSVVCTNKLPALYFESSGTTGQSVSRHYVTDVRLYEDAFISAFTRKYGSPKHWCILGLLPSYLERSHSSLVYMVNRLMQESGYPSNNFFLHNQAALFQQLEILEKNKQPVMLFGTTFALLDFAQSYTLKIPNLTVIETGGMKGRRKEMLREELVHELKKSFVHANIHSEYGMTELFSQAYSDEAGFYHCPPWMRVLVRDEDDPFSVHTHGKGALNIIDLANVYSCSFIATDDLGEVFQDGSFKVLGRLDNSDIRGCSLMTL